MRKSYLTEKSLRSSNERVRTEDFGAVVILSGLVNIFTGINAYLIVPRVHSGISLPRQFLNRESTTSFYFRYCPFTAGYPPCRAVVAFYIFDEELGPDRKFPRISYARFQRKRKREILAFLPFRCFETDCRERRHHKVCSADIHLHSRALRRAASVAGDNKRTTFFNRPYRRT